MSTRSTPTDSATAPVASTPWRGIGAYVALVALLLASAAGFTGYIESVGIQLEKEPIHPASGLTLSSLPPRLPDHAPVWRDTGQRQPISKEVEEELGTSNHVTRFYEYLGPPLGEDTDPKKQRRSEDRPLTIQLHAAYYTGLIDVVPHVPERCFVGGGLRQVGNSVIVPVPLDLQRRYTRDPGILSDTGETVYRQRGVEIPNPVRMPRGIETLKINVSEFSGGGDTRIFAGYFFIANGFTTPTAAQVRLDAFDLKQDYAYYMKVQFLTDQVDSPEELARYAASLLDQIFGELMLRCPDWIEVERGNYPPQDERQPNAEA